MRPSYDNLHRERTQTTAVQADSSPIYRCFHFDCQNAPMTSWAHNRRWSSPPPPTAITASASPAGSASRRASTRNGNSPTEERGQQKRDRHRVGGVTDRASGGCARNQLVLVSRRDGRSG